VLAFHAELETDPAPTPTSDPTLYSTFLDSRPTSLETAALGLITSLLPAYPALRTHIVHLSAAPALPLVRAAKARGARLSAETCFHYLALSAEHVSAGRPEFKCCPPIRGADNRDALWAALADGTLDCVVSDHSPCVAELKSSDLMAAWGGISTLGLGLSVLWTEGRKRGMGIARIMELTALNTAKHAGLDGQKGSLAVGKDADLVLWDPEATFQASAPRLSVRMRHGAHAVYTGHERESEL
jgi:allantoinase